MSDLFFEVDPMVPTPQLGPAVQVERIRQPNGEIQHVVTSNLPVAPGVWNVLFTLLTDGLKAVALEMAREAVAQESTLLKPYALSDLTNGTKH